MIPTVLSIAGSDPCGGAGIQADLKTFSALGGYGCAVISALTAQSTQGVTGVHPIPSAFVRQQVETLVSDLHLDATKIGMLANADVAIEVLALVSESALPQVVLDPVMVSAAGARLLTDDAIAVVRALAQQVELVTPNLPEAALLLGRNDVDLPTSPDAMRQWATDLRGIGCERVLLKGGHLGGAESNDYFVDHQGIIELRAPRVPTRNTHGTGCTLSSAITALRPRQPDWVNACVEAKRWLTEALLHADELTIGAGPGPVHHLWQSKREGKREDARDGASAQ